MQLYLRPKLYPINAIPWWCRNGESNWDEFICDIPMRLHKAGHDQAPGSSCLLEWPLIWRRLQIWWSQQQHCLTHRYAPPRHHVVMSTQVLSIRFQQVQEFIYYDWLFVAVITHTLYLKVRVCYMSMLLSMTMTVIYLVQYLLMLMVSVPIDNTPRQFWPKGTVHISA